MKKQNSVEFYHSGLNSLDLLKAMKIINVREYEIRKAELYFKAIELNKKERK